MNHSADMWRCAFLKYKLDIYERGDLNEMTDNTKGEKGSVGFFFFFFDDRVSW